MYNPSLPVDFFNSSIGTIASFIAPPKSVVKKAEKVEHVNVAVSKEFAKAILMAITEAFIEGKKDLYSLSNSEAKEMLKKFHGWEELYELEKIVSNKELDSLIEYNNYMILKSFFNSFIEWHATLHSIAHIGTVDEQSNDYQVFLCDLAKMELKEGTAYSGNDIDNYLKTLN